MLVDLHPHAIGGEHWLDREIHVPLYFRQGSGRDVQGKEVVVMYKGESDPMVATGDGVKEPQNRCVEIVLE